MVLLAGGFEEHEEAVRKKKTNKQHLVLTDGAELLQYAWYQPTATLIRLPGPGYSVGKTCTGCVATGLKIRQVLHR